MRALAGLLTLSLVACNPMGEAYVVAVDPAFTPQEQADVQAAISGWNTSVTSAGGRLHMSSYVGGCPALLDMTHSTLCLFRSTKAEMVTLGDPPGTIGNTRRDNMDDCARSWLAMDGLGSDADITEAAAHELGHGMGLSHTRPGDLMYVTDTGLVTSPQPNDVNQYEYLRGQATKATYVLDGPAVW